MSSTLVTEACRLIEATDDRVPSAPELAEALDVSPDQLRRAFTRALGVTPRQYGDTLRRERLRERLRGNGDVTGALFEAGYGSTSRLYEGAHDHLGMTPASYKAGGAGATIAYAVADSPLGALLVAATERGLCKIDVGDDAAALEADLAEEFHRAHLVRDDAGLAAIVEDVVARIDGRDPVDNLPLDVLGTAFQRRVWEELRRIPVGEVRTYGEVAAAVGSPGASRAVGSACGANPVPVVVPCHRVVPAGGGIGNYGLGPDRKRRLLEAEGADAVSPAR
ncbi:MAG TPA: methylated-DNA--[protein]-cysteine S-methyltransferase [Acidimicrobiia bacterium]|nr:methylated-DNA--[protein]-cysteine S-methyltransferase [Acidimicrobiia bacterium]